MIFNVFKNKLEEKKITVYRERNNLQLKNDIVTNWL